MQFAILTAVLAAIAAAESGGGPVEGVAWRLFVVGAAMLIAPVAAFVGSERLVGAVSRYHPTDASANRLQSLVTCLWLATVGAILLVGQWPRIVRSNWHLAAWPLVDEIAILLPVLAPLIVIWAALYRLDRASLVAACRARNLPPPPARLAAHLLMQMRHYLGLVLLPPLAIVGILETLTLLGISPDHWQASWWLAIPLVGTVLVLMPLAVRRIWHTSPLPAGPLREMLDGVCDGRKCQVRDILVWDTDYSMANAAVVGFSRRLRYVLLTDVLVAQLSDRQIAAVLRHELAHLRRWHLPLRLALLLLPVAWWLAIDHAWPGAATQLKAFAASLGVPPELAAALVLPVGMLAYALAVVGWYSRLLEHDADIDACLTADRSADPLLAEDFCSALETLCGGAVESRLSQWLHPPVAQRLALIRHLVTRPAEITTFRRQCNLASAAIGIFYVIAVVYALLA